MARPALLDARCSHTRSSPRGLTPENLCCGSCSSRLQVPPNGLVVYTGTVMTEDGKEKKMNIDFE